jgi:hypothetical protein
MSRRTEERRRDRRVRFRVRLDYGARNGLLRAAYAVNVGPTGLFLRTVSPPIPGSHLEIVAYRADGARIEMEGIVRWGRLTAFRNTSAASGCGVELQDPPEAWTQLVSTPARS